MNPGDRARASVDEILVPREVDADWGGSLATTSAMAVLADSRVGATAG